MKTVCGIDFGTSNSTVAIARGGAVTLVPVEGAATSIPSAIFYPNEGAPPLYGRAAVSAYTEHEPGRLMRALKSILSTALIDERTNAGGRPRTFADILTGFVRHLKAKAEDAAGGPIDSVVMGRPVHFVDGDLAADARAEAKLAEIAEAAGFRRIAFGLEPIAAALSFEEQASKPEIAFIADLGGGTSDFCVVAVGPERRGKRDRSGDILADGGVRVGGTNLDMRLSLAAVMPHLGSRSKTLAGHELPRWPFVDLATWHSIHRIDTPKNRTLLKQILDDCGPPVLFQRYMDILDRGTGHALAAAVERGKIDLTSRDVAALNLTGIAKLPAIKATAAGLEEAIATEIVRLQETAAGTLLASGRRADEVTALFLTGGTSAVPAVRRLLSDLLPAARVVEGDLFTSVGYGLALDAVRRFS